MIIVLPDLDFNRYLKFDTEKMKVIAKDIKYKKDYNTLFGDINIYVLVTIYKSKKGRYLLMYKYDGEYKVELLSEESVKSLLIDNDIDAYEKLFGEIEEG